jgi:hypothetical protein
MRGSGTAAQFRWFTILAGLALAGPALAGGSEVGTSPVFAIGPGHVFVDWVPGASSTLVRTEHGISVVLQTSGLPAGHAVTLWALIFNNPSACGGGTRACDEIQGDLRDPAVMGSVQRVTGHVVEAVSSFAGHLALAEADSTAFGPGLLDPWGAEIHLIVREHGVASPDILLDQFHNDSPRFCNVACSDIQKSVHLAGE